MALDGLRRFQALNISRDDFVVEIGSGNDPYWRSDLLVDKYVADSTERPGGFTPLLLDRPLLVGDALQLPFADQSVDFLIARNLLEHIVDVDLFFAEMMRISKRGYITTPSALSEKLFGWLKHVWFVSTDDSTINLKAKEQTLYDDELSQLFHRLYAQDRSFRNFYKKNRRRFVMEYYWDNSIRYQIEGQTKNLELLKAAQASFNLESTISTLNQTEKDKSPRRRLESVARRLASRHHLTAASDVLEKLICPVCQTGLQELRKEEGRSLQCLGCTNIFPIINDIPILVCEAAS